jgi:succinate dehydrogenase/fumarate reductase flavoprotein subunit
MLEVSRLMIRAGLVREETRGVHVRGDFPQPAGRWRAHIGWRRGREEPIFEPLAEAEGEARAKPVAGGGLPTAAALGKN